jgi:hypothetical protein
MQADDAPAASPAERQPADIRRRSGLDHADVAALNFIRDTGRFHFRRHGRSGLRSHVMEVLRVEDLALERFGQPDAGVRRFPRARPVAMLRLFRAAFADVAEALAEIARLRIVERYLGRDQVAASREFIVAYRLGGRSVPMLCGLQEYVEGEVLDPWGCAPRPLEGAARAGAERFVAAVRRLLEESGLIPDLAGVGNLLRVAGGGVKLVDINNISPLSLTAEIHLDDKGYPVGDKSVEALYRLECHFLGRCGLGEDRLYRHFLDPRRCAAVARLHRSFHAGRSRPGAPGGGDAADPRA